MSLKREYFYSQTSFVKRLFTLTLLIVGLLAVGVQSSQAVSPNIVISQVYGGGGNSGATYTNDFIEIFNRGAVAIDVTGWSVQYASSTGTTWQVTPLSGTVQPGQYYLVQEAAGSGGTTPLPTPDVTGSIAMSASSGKVVVTNTTTALSGSNPSDVSIVDVVGFGSANFFEGSGAAPTLSNTTAASRAANGCTDTDNNAGDFAAGPPNPRNTASPFNPCDGPVDNPPSVTSTTPANGDTNVAVDANIEISFSENVTVTDPWFTVICTVGGTQTAVVSGGPQTFTLDPDTDFANDDTCTVTVFASQVTDEDTDDPPDNMAADYSFGFSTVSTGPGQALPLVEDFDDCTLAGWQIISVDADTTHTWSCNSSFSNVDVNGFGDTAPADEWLITPLLNLDAQDHDTLTFRNYTNFTDVNYPQLSVLYSTNYTGNGDPASAAWTALNGINFSPAGSATWVDSGEVDLSGISGTNVYVAFHYVSSGTASGASTNWRIDSVNIYEGTPPPPASSLFFSEYVEGSSSNKALEIYNATSDTVDLSAYTVELYSNGSATPSQSVTLNGTLASGGVFVMANGSASTAILAVADLINNSVVNFNGDDAVVLRNSNGVVDVIGQTGFDPGAEWGSGLVSTQDNTVRRQPHICAGDTDATDPFDPALEWEGFAIDTFDGLGSHASDCVVAGPVAYKIHEIQGSGLASPVVGEEVMIEGVVVGDFQDIGQFGGFHVQEEDADVDADPATSEGIFVYHFSTAVNIGDVVQVAGTVAEYNGLTEITSVSSVTIVSSGSSVTPTAVSLPVATLDELEAYEGMLVTFPQDLVISEYFNFDRYNEIVLTAERQYQPTATFDPGSPEAAALALANSLSRITLDDGRSTQNSDPALHPNGTEFTTSNTFRGGDVLQNVTGIMDYAFGLYKIQPTQGAVHVPQNPRTAQPADVGGTIKVASFNVLNYFSTLDDGVNDICGPAQNQECRGADTAEEFQRQRDKIFAALAAIDADVVGLIEIENHVTDAAVQDLVAGLNAYLGSETYAYVATGPIGTDAIKQAFIYKPVSVNPVGDYAILDSSVDARFLDDYNRPALAQTFYGRYTGGHFTVVVNHLKSKGSDCNAVGDPDLGDGAGHCNITRTLAAQALVDWLAADPTGSGDPDFLIIGDLNSYDKEDPIDAILAGADDVLGSGDDYTDLLYSFVGENAYSYVFDGQLGYLDHGLANAALLPQVTGTTAWHINADEPDIIDYDMDFKQDAQDDLWEPTPYRSSDHDPIVIGLQLEPEGPIVNGDGCYVLGIEGTPYPYAHNLVTPDNRSLQYFPRVSTYLFMAEMWGRMEQLPWDTCYEIHGTDKNDIIFGGRADDVIFGYGSWDVLFGKNGDDVFTGGSGYDQFLGDGGYDTVLDHTAGEKCASVEEGCTSHGYKREPRK